MSYTYIHIHAYWCKPCLVGTVQFGLTSLCQQSLEQEVICVTPNLPLSWTACLVFIVFGVLTLTLTCILLILSQWKPKATEYGKWIAVISCKQSKWHCVCNTSLIDCRHGFDVLYILPHHNYCLVFYSDELESGSRYLPSGIWQSWNWRNVISVANKHIFGLILRFVHILNSLHIFRRSLYAQRSFNCTCTVTFV